jgi:hypothetical protein
MLGAVCMISTSGLRLNHELVSDGQSMVSHVVSFIVSYFV